MGSIHENIRIPTRHFIFHVPTKGYCWSSERDTKLTSYSLNWCFVGTQASEETDSTASSDDKIDGTTLSRKSTFCYISEEGRYNM